MMTITKCYEFWPLQILQETFANISLLILQQTPPLFLFFTATLSVIDRKAERRLLASKDSWRKPLCRFEVLIDAIVVRIGEKSSAAANLLWFIFQEE